MAARSQMWSGKMGTRRPHPMKTVRKIHHWVSGSRPVVTVLTASSALTLAAAPREPEKMRRPAPRASMLTRLDREEALGSQLPVF